MKALVLGSGASGKAAEAVLRSRGYNVDVVNGYDIVIASPGITVRSELQLGVEKLRSQGTKLLAVTGSKGKSSVVKLITEAINLSGKTAVACGNYGLPVCDVGKTDWAVVEVSSFQLETTYLSHDAFRAAAILNLQEDHLDRHGEVATYHSLKRRLLNMAEIAIDESSVNKKDEEILKNSYFDNAILRENGLIAIALMRAASLSDEIMREAFKSFAPLPHRMNLVANYDGIKFIDDSKATSLAALAAGVVMTGSEKVRLIAGGLPKGDDAKSVIPYLTKQVKKVYLIGNSAEAFFSAWSNDVNCEISHTLDKAFESAMCDAEEGDTILLSPGAASYDQFKNFGERGDAFASLVQERRKKQ